MRQTEKRKKEEEKTSDCVMDDMQCKTKKLRHDACQQLVERFFDFFTLFMEEGQQVCQKYEDTGQEMKC